jgi:PAS domain S-box-containing protein
MKSLSPIPALLIGLSVVVLYVVGGLLGLSLPTINPSATAVWPPTGIALVALLVWGYRMWPAVFIGAFVVNVLKGTVATTWGIAAGNTLEALVGAWLVREFAGGAEAFARPQSVIRFVAYAAILSTMVSATLGVTSLCLGGLAPWKQFGAVWLTWWLGDMVSDVLVAPALLIWITFPRPRLNRERILEAGAILLAIVAIGAVIFPETIPALDKNIPISYLALLPMLWAAIRFGQRGAASAAVVTSAIALAGTLHGYGPFAKSDPNQSLLLLQAFVGTLAVTALLLAAVSSDRGEATSALTAKERELRLITDVTPVLLTRCSRDLRYVFVNRAYAEMLGRTPSEISGKTIREIMGDAGYESIRPHVERVLRGEPVEYEEDVLFKGVGLRSLRVSYRPDRDAAGNVRGWVASILDVTAHKQADRALAVAQEQLRQHAETLEKTVADRTGELRATNAELEAFSYSLSHDLRAPLRSIRGFTMMALDEHRTELGASAANLERVIRATDRMDRLIQDVLAFSRVSRQQLVVEPVDVEKLVRGIVQERQELQPPRAEVEVREPLLMVRGDQASLTQCVTNLLDNAVKFTAPEIVPKVRIRSEAAREKVRLWFEDNGIGIERETQSKIFDLFQRGHADGAYEGTGIGLAIVRRAVERMGGQVGVESEIGRGSRFWIELPAA